eukprot:COSAG04_NODE_98_length_26386_cov_21.212729_6_plen_151_part_00
MQEAFLLPIPTAVAAQLVLAGEYISERAATHRLPEPRKLRPQLGCRPVARSGGVPQDQVDQGGPRVPGVQRLLDRGLVGARRLGAPRQRALLELSQLLPQPSDAGGASIAAASFAHAEAAPRPRPFHRQRVQEPLQEGSPRPQPCPERFD